MAESYDLDAMAADDALLDLLAAGGEAAFEALETSGSDPAILLLTDLRLAVEVEDELPVEHIEDAETFLARCAALNPVTDPFARKVAARTLALGVAAVAALSVSGVAAAVTGDPLSPYEKMIEKVVNGFLPEISFPADEIEGLPVNDKARITKVAKDYKERRTAELRREKVETETGGQSERVIGFPAKVKGSNEVRPPLVGGEVDTGTDLGEDKPPLVVDKTDRDPDDTIEPSAKPTVAPTTQPTTSPTPTPTPTATTTPPPDPTPTPTPTPSPTPTQTEVTTVPTVPPTTTGGDMGEAGEKPVEGGQPGTGGATTPVPSATPTQPSGGNGQQGSDDGGTKDEGETGDEQDADPGTGPGNDHGNDQGDQGDQGEHADQGDHGNQGEHGDKGDKGQGEGTGLGDQVGELVGRLPIVGDQTSTSTGTGGGASAEHRKATGRSGFTPAVLRQILAMLNGVMVTR